MPGVRKSSIAAVSIWRLARRIQPEQAKFMAKVARPNSGKSDSKSSSASKGTVNMRTAAYPDARPSAEQHLIRNCSGVQLEG
jgi:hypothetical protein